MTSSNSPRFSIWLQVTLATALVLLVAGCNGNGTAANGTTANGPTASAPMATLTPIANCIVNSEDDVIIGGPDADPGCQNVEMEPSSANPSLFDEIRIEDGGTLTILGGASSQVGTLAFRTRDTTLNVPLETPVREICVGNGGTLQFDRGTADKPITNKNKVILKFLGSRHSANPEQICKQEPTFKKGIDVEAGGSLLMYGAKGVPSRNGVSWTTLAAPAGSLVQGAKVKSTGTTTLQLTADVTKGLEGWEPGNWIVVTTTSYTPFDSEFVQIASVKSNTDGGSTVTLVQPLKYYHFGSLAPSSASATCPDPLYPAHSATSTQPAFLCDGANRNYGVDERAEVGLISRDIELVSAVPTEADSLHWGGEIMIHANFKQVAIQGVRLSKFGKDQLGSYPIHFHEVGDAQNKPLIDADSVDHSYNKCVTIHSTSNLTISNLVCARIVGHIFYEELQSAGQDNPGDDSGLVFDHDLGIGSMSNSFDINPVTLDDGTKMTRQQLIDKYWWTGDYMTNADCTANGTCINYDGFNIPDTDNPKQATHGFCQAIDITGGFYAGSQPPCTEPKLYIEPASGFWIQNPDTVLTDDSIAGCQGEGRGFWWVPPSTPIKVNGVSKEMVFQPLGKFQNNRASACYSGYFGEGEDITSGQMTPHKDGVNGAASIIATLDGMTATHNRYRAAWLRPTWFVIKNGHFANNNRNVSLVTSGGIDGNAPGVWDLLKDSVLVGESQDNVDRWGPCPKQRQLGPYTGAEAGCIDHTPPPASTTPHSGEFNSQGYPPPNRNSFGYLLYDGPVRVFHDRFVNFNRDDPVPDYSAPSTDCSNRSQTGCAFSKELDDADLAYLIQYSKAASTPTGQKPFVYEGDAAFGWFPSNQSSYPTGTASKELTWVNSNLRHQIYTELVGINNVFNDGDKNTAIIDEDGTLSGLGVKVGDPAVQPNTVHPISLNNLPFNATSNSVDECLSRGGQNAAIEGRDSSLMSPASMGTLEFSTPYPFVPSSGNPVNPDYPGHANSHYQYMTFTRDDAVPNGKGGTFRPFIQLKSRDGLGLWEPKVSSGYGYTVRVAPIPNPPPPPIPPDLNSGKAGIWKWIDVGVADVVDPNISAAHPFFIQLGINYSNTDGTHPADKFMIERGYKAYTGGNTWPNDPGLLKYWTDLACKGLDDTGPIWKNIPWNGNGFAGTCPAGTVTELTEAPSIAGLTKDDGSPNLGVYYYNQATGMLYLNIAQDEPNPVGPSPTGSCNADGTGDPSCPDIEHGETYYACPKNGCIIYTIAQNDSAYSPGASVGEPLAANLKPAPANPNQLVVQGTNTVIQRTSHLDKQGTVYYTADNAPACTATQPPQP